MASIEESTSNMAVGRRLFVVCGNLVATPDLRQAFEAYGKIENYRLIREKGVAYITMDSAENAEAAVEALNGAELHDSKNTKLVRVMIAEDCKTTQQQQQQQATGKRLSSDAGPAAPLRAGEAEDFQPQPQQQQQQQQPRSMAEEEVDPDNTPPRSRLFIVCPRNAQKELLEEAARAFEDVQYCKTDLVNSKGILFVKFTRSSSALRALEDISTAGTLAGYKVKCMVAEPKAKRGREGPPEVLYALPSHQAARIDFGGVPASHQVFPSNFDQSTDVRTHEYAPSGGPPPPRASPNLGQVPPAGAYPSGQLGPASSWSASANLPVVGGGGASRLMTPRSQQIQQQSSAAELQDYGGVDLPSFVGGLGLGEPSPRSNLGPGGGALGGSSPADSGAAAFRPSWGAGGVGYSSSVAGVTATHRYDYGLLGQGPRGGQADTLGRPPQMPQQPASRWTDNSQPGPPDSKLPDNYPVTQSHHTGPWQHPQHPFGTRQQPAHGRVQHGGGYGAGAPPAMPPLGYSPQTSRNSAGPMVSQEPYPYARQHHPHHLALGAGGSLASLAFPQAEHQRPQYLHPAWAQQPEPQWHHVQQQQLQQHGRVALGASGSQDRAVSVTRSGGDGLVSPATSAGGEMQHSGSSRGRAEHLPGTVGANPQRLFVVVSKSVTSDSLSRLFKRFPGMEYCDLKRDSATGKSKGYAYVNYSTHRSAAAAVDQLNGTEFPPSHRIKVMFAEPMGARSGSRRAHSQAGGVQQPEGEASSEDVYSRTSLVNGNRNVPGKTGLPEGSTAGSGTDQSEEGEEAVEGPRLSPKSPVLAKTEAVEHQDISSIQNSLSALKTSPEEQDAKPTGAAEATASKRCPAGGDTRQPPGEDLRGWDAIGHAMDLKDSKEVQVYMFLEKPLPDYAVKHVFSAHGEVTSVVIHPDDQRYGLVRYSKPEDAMKALKALDGTDIFGIPLSVHASDPLQALRTTKRARVGE